MNNILLLIIAYTVWSILIAGLVITILPYWIYSFFRNNPIWKKIKYEILWYKIKEDNRKTVYRNGSSDL